MAGQLSTPPTTRPAMGSSSKKDKSERKDKSSSRKHHKSSKSSSKHSSSSKNKVVDDNIEEDEWVEKSQPGSESSAAAPRFTGVDAAPSSESYKVHGNPSSSRREDWLGLGHTSSAPAAQTDNTFDTRTKESMAAEGDITDGFGSGENGQNDVFGSLGTATSSRRARQQRELDRSAELASKPQMSDKELNRSAFGGQEGAAAAAAAAGKPKAAGQQFGGPGSGWRMTKLKRLYEAAAEEGVPVESMALDRFGTMEAFEEAKQERRFLDGDQSNPQLAQSVTQPGPLVDEFGREIRPSEAAPASSEGQQRQQQQQPANAATRLLFNDSSAANSDFSRPSSRQSFKRPGESPAASGPAATSAASSRFNSPKPSTPIPSVIAPVPPPASQTAPASSSVSQSDLNRMQAKVLKANLMDPDSEETQQLQQEYHLAVAAFHSASASTSASAPPPNEEVRVLPSLDGRGKLYDIGTSSAVGPDAQQLSRHQKRKRDEQFESRDKHGNLVRYNADDDEQSLADLVRAEKFGGGPAEDKDLNKQLAGRIARDATFQNDTEYMDDVAEKLGRKKVRDEDRKRLWAIQDYAKTQKALDSCWFCHQEDEDPKVPIVAMGTRAYLALNRFEGLSDAHCLIVPISHHLASLEADEDTWEEIKNFMKTLMQMAGQNDHGVIFFETATNLKSQKHTYIEAIPVPWKVYEDAPGYFKESILMAESEWSQNKRLIDFSQRPGGFRRSMVPNLPYFAVQFDYKGQEGYGHIIEGHDGVQGGADGFDLDEAERGGGKFEKFFGAEIVGNLLELEPRRWRRPKRLDRKDDAARVAQFRRAYDPFDWTKMLGES